MTNENRELLRFTVPTIPQGKGRGRAIRVGPSVRVVTPNKTRVYEAVVADLARQAHGTALLEGPLEVSLFFAFPRTKDLAKIYKKGNRPKHHPGYLWAPTIRKDLDNLAKAVLDALNGVVYLDDRQVVSLRCGKVYTKLLKRPNPGAGVNYRYEQQAPHVHVAISRPDFEGAFCPRCGVLGGWCYEE